MCENSFIFKDYNRTILAKYIGNEECVTIPEGVSVIGEAAFTSCYNLKEVNFPNTLTEIKKLAFYNCVNLNIEFQNLLNTNVAIADDAFLACPNIKYLKDRYILTQRTIQEIEDNTLKVFYVKDYQRGYRWTKNEIEELLNDINETNGKYCVQPLIVKECKPEGCSRCIDCCGIHEGLLDTPTVAYELIDGQQRLTTLLLILKECSEKLCNEKTVSYSIYYELLRKIDDHYIGKAQEIIKEWINNSLTDDDKIKNFVYKIRQNLFFIWYEMKTDNIAVETEFRNINDGQTPLTNAELFKALLLNPENASVYEDGHKEDIHAKLFEMAFQWDEMEQNLRNDGFWFFISNTACEERTHLDYLFELFAVRLEEKNARQGSHGQPKAVFDAFKNKIEKLDKSRDRYSFLAVKAYVEYLDSLNNKNRFESVKQVWQEIVEQYNRLYSWFTDLELYHTVGYLIATEKAKNGNSIVPEIVVELFNKHYNSNLTDIKDFAKIKIFDYLENQVKDNGRNITILSPNYYERNKKDIRDFLLFVNVWSTYSAHEKFPFSRFKNTKDKNTKKIINWDIEHISARNLKVDISPEELNKIKDWWQKEDDNLCKAERKWDEREWKDFAKRVNDDEPDNSISNLVLLDSNTNRSYGDALFFGKRKEIIERDRKSAYIPICTKNVFLKYYTSDPDFSTAWTEKDKKGYLWNILICVKDGIFGCSPLPATVEAKYNELRNSYMTKEDE